MGTISIALPVVGLPDTTEDVKLINALGTLQTVINGGIDSTNLSPTASIARSQMAGGFGNLIWTPVVASSAAADGHFYEVGAAATITLPSPTLNATVGVFVLLSGYSVTVTASSGLIIGLGAAAVASFQLGAQGANAVLVGNGSNWRVVSGMQDTGWVALTMTSGITQVAGAYAASARVVGDTGKLCGIVQNTSGFSITSPLTVPVGLRPSSLVAGGQGSATSSWSIATNGAVTIGAGIPAGVQFGLDSITYRIS